MRYVPFPKFDKLVRRLRKLIRSESKTARRDALAVVLGLHGLRVTEVVRLRVGDLDAVDESLAVATLKRGKPRRMQLGSGVFRALRKLGAKRAKDEPLFVTATGSAVRHEHWQKFARELTGEVLGGEGLRFHAFRHTFAMRLYHATKDVQRVKSRLGHRSAASTQVYLDAYAELDDRALDRLGKVAALPSLVVDRTSHKPAKDDRPRRPSSGRRTRAVPCEKNSVSLGKEQEIDKIVRAKTGLRAKAQQFPVFDRRTTEQLQVFKLRIVKDLEQAVEASRKSG